MDISQIITRINLNLLIVHVKTTILLVICSLHSLGTYIITDNNKNQPQLVDSSCLDNSFATSEAMQ